MISKQTFCVGGRQKSNTYNGLEYEKDNPKTKKCVNVRKEKLSICGHCKSHVFNM